MDVCEDGFTGKRIAFIVPMVLMGMLFIARAIGKGLFINCCTNVVIDHRGTNQLIPFRDSSPFIHVKSH